MSYNLSNQHYLQGGYDFDFIDGLDSRLECPICIRCLRNPHQTSCGHRFCHSCIMTWLTEGKTCPLDNCSLSEGDIFADALAAREILQLAIKCPNHKKGCPSTMSLADVEKHMRACHVSIRREARSGDSKAAVASLTCGDCGELISSMLLNRGGSHNLICPNAPVACPFANAGCTDHIRRVDLADHVQTQISHHLQLINEKLMKIQQSQIASLHTEEGHLVQERSRSESTSTGTNGLLPRDDQLRLSGSNVHGTQKLLKDLYQRMVTLEQRNCHQAITNEYTRQKFKDAEAKLFDVEKELLGRFCNGRFIWRLTNFSHDLENMRVSKAFVLYSDGFHSAPVMGYKMCLRCNLHTMNGQEYLGIFIHLMRGTDDDVVSWPFLGKITVTVKNRVCTRDDFTETMVTPLGLGAFDRPVRLRTPVGFGLQQFILTRDLHDQGYIDVDEDILVITAVVKTTPPIDECRYQDPEGQSDS